MFRGLALCGGCHSGGHRDAGRRGRHRWVTLPELDLFALPTRLCGDWSHRRLGGPPHRDCQGTNSRWNFLCPWLHPQWLCSGHAHHDRWPSHAGHGRWRAGITGVYRCVHSVSEKIVGADHRCDFRSLGRVFLVRPADWRVFCSRGELAWSVLGVCGTGLGCRAGGPTALKSAVPDAKGTDAGDALGTARSFRHRGVGDLSSRSDDLHWGRQRLMCRRRSAAVALSKTGCG